MLEMVSRKCRRILSGDVLWISLYSDDMHICCTGFSVITHAITSVIADTHMHILLLRTTLYSFFLSFFLSFFFFHCCPPEFVLASLQFRSTYPPVYVFMRFCAFCCSVSNRSYDFKCFLYIICQHYNGISISLCSHTVSMLLQQYLKDFHLLALLVLLGWQSGVYFWVCVNSIISYQ